MLTSCITEVQGIEKKKETKKETKKNKEEQRLVNVGTKQSKALNNIQFLC